MATRVTGMVSGLDTESIIQQLVAVRQTKVDTKKGEQKKNQWAQDSWKELNTKLKSLMSTVSNMRLSSDYSKRTSKVSGNSATVLTSDGAAVGTRTLRVQQLAKTGYLTGAKIGSGTVKSSTKLNDLVEGGAENGSLTVKVGDKEKTIDLTGTTSINGVVSKLQSAGVNASYDEKQGRLFISAKESGAASDFEITAGDAAGAKILSALGLQTKSSYSADYVANAAGTGIDEAATLASKSSAISSAVELHANNYVKNYESLLSQKTSNEEKIAELNEKYAERDLSGVATEDFEALLTANSEAIEAKKQEIADLAAADPEADNTSLKDELKALQEETTALKDLQKLQGYMTTAADLDTQIVEAETNLVKDGEGNVVLDEDGHARVTDSYKASLRSLEEASVLENARASFSKDGTADDGTNYATRVTGQDAIIYLNDAMFTSNSNSFEIDGLTITAQQATGDKEETITTENDTSAIYDMIKTFMKQYSELVNEMDKLYNADSASKYSMLTDDQKDAMSDKEVEEWEDKIKSALLRRDSTLGNVNSTIQSVMSQGFTVGDKTLYLSDFGINTLSYFSAPDNEKHAYHIDGDEDDENTKSSTNVLKNMIASDPDTVTSFFQQLSSALYSKMSSLSGSSSYSSYGSFYDDKRLKTEYDSFTSTIENMEEKLTDYEDKWYSKFSKMETALSKLQANANAIGGILGTGSQQ